MIPARLNKELAYQKRMLANLLGLFNAEYEGRRWRARKTEFGGNLLRRIAYREKKIQQIMDEIGKRGMK